MATVTDTNRLVMKFRGETIVDMSRAFLDTNGVRAHQAVEVCESEYDENHLIKKTQILLKCYMIQM